MSTFNEKLRFAQQYAVEVVAETLWPTRCAACDALGDVLCRSCAEKLKFVDTCLACPSCGAPFGKALCTECNDVMMRTAGRETLPYEAMAHAVMLDNAARKIVTTYKDKSERRLGPIIAKTMARYVPPEWMSEDAAVSFVPDTLAAKRRRGFDHSQELAQLVAAECGLQCISLFERPHSSDQRELTREQRVRNMRAKLLVKPKAVVPKKVIVTDDVCTTGATLYAAADALRNAGAENLYALTFGRVLD